MATDAGVRFEVLSERIANTFEKAEKDRDGNIRTTPQFFNDLIIEVHRLESALALANTTIAIMKGEQTFNSPEEFNAYLSDTRCDDVMFSDDIPVVKLIDTANGGT